MGSVSLVLQVLKKHDRNGNIAHSVKAENQDSSRNRTDVPATRLAVVNRIDQAKNLVGQRKILEDRTGEMRDTFLVRMRNLVDCTDRFRQGRKIAFVPHSPQ